MENSTSKPPAARDTDTFPIHTATRLNSRVWRPATITFDDIVRWVENPADQKECVGYVGGSLENNTRSKKTVLSRSLITLDVDHPGPDFLMRVDLSFRWRSIWHTTYSSTPESPRYRGIIIPDRELTPEEYRAVVQGLILELNAVQEDKDHQQFDLSTDQPERFMWRPATQDPATYGRLILADSRPLPVDEYVRASGSLVGAPAEPHEPTSPAEPAEHQEIRVEPLDETSLIDDPFTKPWPIGKFNTEHRDFAELVEAHDLPYTKAGNGRWRYTPASSPAGMTEVSPGRWYSQHSSDPVHGYAHTAFDLVRIHKFGPLDAGVAPATPTAQRPSHQAMIDYATDSDEDAQYLGQTRIAVRFAGQYRGQCAFLFSVGWRTWTGQVWAQDKGQKHAYEAVKKVVGEAFAAGCSGDKSLRAAASSASTASGVRGVLDLASRELQVDEMDTDPWLLNCQNGTLNLRTLELLPHDPNDQLSKITKAAYRPDARRETWERFITEAIPDPEVRAFLQRFVGQSLIGTTVEHVLCILYGQLGRNGKSTFAETLNKALGDYAETVSNQLIVENKYGGKSTAGDLAATMKLKGLRLATMSEISGSDKMHEARMKELTGGDTIQAKWMRENPINWDPSHSLMMLTNELPVVAAESQAVWARIRIVPFPRSFEGEEDTGLKDQLKGSQEVLDAVLAWAVAGLREWQKRRGLDAPDAVLAEVQEYRDENNPVAEFVAERCVTGNRVEIPKSDLHLAYGDWALDNGKPAISDRKFPQKLSAAVPRVKERKDSKGKRYWQGIDLKDGDLS